MGGNALKHLNPVRLTSSQMLALWSFISERCTVLGLEAHLVPWLRSKEDHGDMDILIATVKDPEKELRLLSSLWVQHKDARHNIQNGPVRSVAVPSAFGVVQVDLIHIPPEAMAFSRVYFSNGGLGMFVGQVARAMGLKLTSDGLYVAPLSGLAWESPVFLTDDPLNAFGFLGYQLLEKPYIECEEQLFHWLLSGRYSAPWIFLPRKPMDRMCRFREYIQAECPTPSMMPPSGYSWEASRATSIKLAEAAFGIPITQRFAQQKAAWEDKKAKTYATGLGALLEIAPDLNPLKAGQLICEMQRHMLPDSIQAAELAELQTQMLPEWALDTKFVHTLAAARAAAKIVIEAHAHDIGEYK